MGIRAVLLDIDGVLTIEEKIGEDRLWVEYGVYEQNYRLIESLIRRQI
jgi:hypothetical protein